MFEDRVRDLLELYSIEEALELLEVTEQECLEILLKHGYAVLPPFMEEASAEEEEFD